MKMFFNHGIHRIYGMVVSLILLLLVRSSFAAIWYVDAAKGNDENSGASWDSALVTIQKAIDISSDGDTVVVGDGIYDSIDAKNKRIIIRSKNGFKSTVIDGRKTSRCFVGGGGSLSSKPCTTLEGFTLCNGNAQAGLSTMGGASVGGLLVNCFLQNNNAHYNAGAAWYSEMENCLITGSTVDSNGGAYCTVVYQCTLRNCTIVNNRCSRGTSVAYGSNLYNCIVYDNSPNAIQVTQQEVKNCYTSDPLFVDVDSGDYRLKKASPCIDAGSNSHSSTVADLAGKARIYNGTVDIGAYEYSPNVFSISSVTAAQRYPWNGLVDLKFTITGESGTKYDTSFVAKDMVGGTNIAMKTIRKSDGTSAAAVEQLLPGSYNWVWDAPADLQVDTATYNAFISDSSTVLITNRSLSATANFYAVFGGSSISQSIGSTEGYAYNVKTEGNGKSIQFQVLNGGYLKCVCVHLEQSGSDIVGHIKWARYMSPTFPLGTDFDTAEYTEYDISTSDSVTGYGIKQLVLTYPNTSREPKFDRLTVTGTADLSAFPYTVKFNANGGTGTMANQSFTYGTSKALTANAFTRTGYVFQGWATSASGGTVYNDKQKVQDLTTTSGAVVNLYAVWKAALYMVIDLSSGPNSSKYPVSYLDAVPSGGWSDTYKTIKLVLRRIEAGSFKMCGQYNVTLTKPFYIGVFEMTQKQCALITGSIHSFYEGNLRPVDDISWDEVRGSSDKYNWPQIAAISSDSVMGRLSSRTGVSFDLPTEAQWEYACRAGTTSKYNNGENSEEDLRLVGRYFGNYGYHGDGLGGYIEHTKVGMYISNLWGLYDMHGNVCEWCLDWYGSLEDNVVDPQGPTSHYDGGRVVRGGSYGHDAAGCTSSWRDYSRAYFKEGFRVCVNLD